MDDKFPPRTIFWPSMRDRPFYDGIKDMMIQREPDAEIGSLYITIPNPDYKPAKYKEYEKQLEHFRRYENTNHPVKKPIEPTPPFEPMSDAEFKKILIGHGVTKNPETNFNYDAKKTTSNKIGNTNKTKSNKNAHSTIAPVMYASNSNDVYDDPILDLLLIERSIAVQKIRIVQASLTAQILDSADFPLPGGGVHSTGLGTAILKAVDANWDGI